jgi:hypothetical protein
MQTSEKGKLVKPHFNLPATVLMSLFVTLPICASAADISGVAVSGEASFDDNVFSIGDNTYPASAGEQNNQYHFSQDQIVLKKETDELSFLGRLNYAPTTVSTPSGAATYDFGTLDQLEIYYKIRPDLQIGFGRLTTTLGMESQMRTANALYNYTVAYQAIVPGYGEGATIRYNPGEYLAVSVSSYNRATYNQFGDDSTSTKTTEVSATGALGPITWFGGYYRGVDIDATALKVDKSTGNAWVMWKISEAWNLNVSYDSRSQKTAGADSQVAQSVSGHLSYALGKQTWAARYESLLGAGNLDSLSGTTDVYYAIGIDQVQIFTVGDKISLNPHLDLHVEYRTDHADQKLMKTKSGGLTDKASMFTVGLVTHF